MRHGIDPNDRPDLAPTGTVPGTIAHHLRVEFPDGVITVSTTLPQLPRDGLELLEILAGTILGYIDRTPSRRGEGATSIGPGVACELEQARARVAELEAEVAALRPDAERWRALVQHSGPAHDAVHALEQALSGLHRALHEGLGMAMAEAQLRQWSEDRKP